MRGGMTPQQGKRRHASLPARYLQGTLTVARSWWVCQIRPCPVDRALTWTDSTNPRQNRGVRRGVRQGGLGRYRPASRACCRRETARHAGPGAICSACRTVSAREVRARAGRARVGWRRPAATVTGLTKVLVEPRGLEPLTPCLQNPRVGYVRGCINAGQSAARRLTAPFSRPAAVLFCRRPRETARRRPRSCPVAVMRTAR